MIGGFERSEFYKSHVVLSHSILCTVHVAVPSAYLLHNNPTPSFPYGKSCMSSCINYMPIITGVIWYNLQLMDDIILLAGCLIQNPYGRILLLHRGGEEDGRWELPGGKVEQDEAPVMAAIREINEELGVNVDISRALGSEVFEEGDKAYKFHWFQAVITDGVPDVMEAETFDDLDYFDIEDLPGLALSANMLVLQQKLLTGEVVLEQ